MSAPLYEFIKKTFISPGFPGDFHITKEAAHLLFCTPGHRQGTGLLQDFAENLARFDITELHGSDNLHFPQGVIKEAQDLCAKAFGAKEAHFLVNGSTCGVMAAICLCGENGGMILAGRDSHTSILNALYLCGSDAIFKNSGILEKFNIPLCITAEDVEKTLLAYPEIKTVFVTSPNYYGICTDIASIYKVCVKYGATFIVDQAHGAHFPFLQEKSEFCAGGKCDIWIISGHKTLPVLTMGSYLFTNGNINTEKLRFYLRLFQTTSPSYPIMASLDLAREYMEMGGRAKLTEIVNVCAELKNRINLDTPLRALTENDLPIGFKLDPCRITVNFAGFGITGYEAEKILREDYGIYCEMADINNAVFIFTTADKKENADRLLNALKSICENITVKTVKSVFTENLKRFIELINIQTINVKKAISESMANKSEYMELQHSVGLKAASMVTIYPPGVPLLLPGEYITQDKINIICETLKFGGAVNGITDGKIQAVLK